MRLKFFILPLFLLLAIECRGLAQIVILDSVLNNPACAGSTVTLKYKVVGGTFVSPFTITARLTNAAFSPLLVSSSVSDTDGGSFSIMIPSSMSSGMYKLRISSVAGQLEDTVDLRIERPVFATQFVLPPTNTCEGYPTLFTAFASNATHYAFSIIGGTLPNQGDSISAFIYARFDSSNVGTGHAITVRASNSCGFSPSATASVIIHDTVRAPIFDPSLPVVRCQGDPQQEYFVLPAKDTSFHFAYSFTPSAAGALKMVGNGSNAHAHIDYSKSFASNVTIQVTEASSQCQGTKTVSLNVTVNPAPIQNATRVFPICSGNVTSIPLIGGASYRWATLFDPAVTKTGPDSTTGAQLANTLINASNGVQKNLTFLVTTISSAGCLSLEPDTDRVVVYPKPVLANITPNAICSKSKPSFQLISTTGSGSTLSWNYDPANSLGILPTGSNSGTDSIINPVLEDTSNSIKGFASYTVTITSPSTLNTCSSVQTIHQDVNPQPAILNASLPTICSGSLISVPLHSSDLLSNTSWTVDINAVIGDTAGSGSTIVQRLINLTATYQLVKYNITATSLFGCVGITKTLFDTVHPTPNTIAPLPNITLSSCSHTHLNILLQSTLSTSIMTCQPYNVTALAIFPSSVAGRLTDSIVNPTATTAITQTYALHNIMPRTGCADTPTYFNIVVNPKPLFNLLTKEICSGDTLDIDLAGNIITNSTIGNTFTWTNANTSLITGQTSNPSFLALTHIRQPLTNSSNSAQGRVSYIITPQSSYGCIGEPVSALVLVDPLPILTSVDTTSICSDEKLNVMLASSTGPGSSYTYTSAATPNNIATRNLNTPVGITTEITDALSSAGALTPSEVVYTIKLRSAVGCINPGQLLKVTVNPTPSAPGITELLNPFPLKLCEGLQNVNLSTTRKPDIREYFVWASDPTCTVFQQPHYLYSWNALASYNNPNPKATISVSSSAYGYQCPSKISSMEFNVVPANMPTVRVLRLSDNLICEAGNVIAYQWGYDDKDLTPHIIVGATAQNLEIADAPHYNEQEHAYWVLVTFRDDCQQKAYHNISALGVGTKRPQMVSVNLYPNPVTDQLHITLSQLSSKETVFAFFDLTGRLLGALQAIGTTTDIPIQNLVPGCYFLTCTQAGMRIATIRFIKQ